MCRPASGVFTKGHTYHWSKTSDSHEEIIEEHHLNEDGVRGPNIVRFEISPPNGDLSLPLDQWIYMVDQDVLPDWYDEAIARREASAMLKEWASYMLTGWNVHEAFHPVNPLLINRMNLSYTTMRDALRDWARVVQCVRDSVMARTPGLGRDCIGDSLRASVPVGIADHAWRSVWANLWYSLWNSLWNSVRARIVNSERAGMWDSVRAGTWDSVRAAMHAYICGLFPNIREWKYAESLGPDPWRPLLTLWYAGYIPSLYGDTWRLHAGKDAEIVLEIKAMELMRG